MTDWPTEWPAPVETLNAKGQADIVLLCEHASNHIPSSYRRLGLVPEELQRHIAWDIGAAEVTRKLSKSLDAPAFLGTYSRLLIDLNRPLVAPDSIPTRSEATDIPGNTRISTAEATQRAERIFMPFHEQIATFLDRRGAERRPTWLVSIHSFTPVFLGVSRPWQAGVLFADAAEFGAKVLSHLKSLGVPAEANVPYKTDRLGDYAIPVHGDDRGIPAIMIEIRNDLIDQATGAKTWAGLVAGALGTRNGNSADR